MRKLTPIKFSRRNDGTYVCSCDGDMSGVYYQAADAQRVIDDLCNRVDTLIAIVKDMEVKK